MKLVQSGNMYYVFVNKAKEQKQTIKQKLQVHAHVLLNTNI